MSNLVYTIASTKRKLKEASDKLDEVFKEHQEIIEAKREALEEKYKKYKNFDRDKLVLRITQRMVYLSRTAPHSLTADARLDELSKLLDYLGED